jgi:hypothetical protein
MTGAGAGPAGGRRRRDARPSADADEQVEVRLLGLPLHLMRASREHHDGLMREFRLLALAGQVSPDEIPARLVELVRVLNEQYSATRERRDAELDAAIAAGHEVLDQVVSVPPATAGAVARPEADAERRRRLLPRRGALHRAAPSARPRFSDWYLEQFLDQLAGADPVPWDGPLRVEG